MSLCVLDAEDDTVVERDSVALSVTDNEVELEKDGVDDSVGDSVGDEDSEVDKLSENVVLLLRVCRLDSV